MPTLTSTQARPAPHTRDSAEPARRGSGRPPSNPPARRRDPLLFALVALVDLTAVAVLAALANRADLRVPVAVVPLALAAFVAGLWPARLTSARLNLVAVHAFVFSALAMYGPVAGIVTDLAGLAGALLGRGRRPQLAHTAFNAGTAVVGPACAWYAMALVAGWAESSGTAALSVLAAAGVYGAVNLGLVTAAISLERDLPIGQVARTAAGASSLPLFAEAATAVLIVSLAGSGAWLEAALLVFCPTWLLIRYNRGLAD